jgi:hypothetical protein
MKTKSVINEKLEKITEKQREGVSIDGK